MVIVFGPKDEKPKDMIVVNTTSGSTNWSRQLSPFLLGPVNLYGDLVAWNVENAWQYAKLYPSMSKDGRPTELYWKWATHGWDRRWADRYPMGKNAKPLGHWWDEDLLDYERARREIYIPLYSSAVRNTEVFKQLKELYEKEKTIALFDYDGYIPVIRMGMTSAEIYEQVIKDTKKKMGHAFVLGMMLEGLL